MVLVSSSLCARRPPVLASSSFTSSKSTFVTLGGGRKGGAIHRQSRQQQPLRRRAVVSSVVSPDTPVLCGSRGGGFGGPFTTRGGRSAPRKGGVFWRRTRAKSFEMEEETEESQTLSIATKLVHPKTSVEDPYAASAPPLYQTATFAQPNATENGRYDYTRSGNPSRDQLEEQFADIEGATRAFAFSSGMSLSLIHI